MAGKRKRNKANAARRALVWMLVCALLLTGAVLAVSALRRYLAARQLRQEAADAGIWKYSADIPRSPYLHDGFSVDEAGRVHYEDDTFYAETGIDVSVHQGEIDWSAAAADGISFAIVQAGYRGYQDGGLGEDTTFRTNLAGAQAAGLETGVYFFSQAVNTQEAEEEAAYVLSLLQGMTIDLPVFYDWEPVDAESARTQGVDGETVTACAKAFCTAVEAGGYEAGVYFSQNLVYTTVELAELLEYPLWMAQYAQEPDFFYDFAWWQYTDSGTVAGISAPVDLDLRFVRKG